MQESTVQPESLRLQEEERTKRHKDCIEWSFLANSTEPSFCDVIWDGVLCWNKTTSGSTALLPCPAYIYGFDPQGKASKLCTAAGTWYRNDKNVTWTNYSLCNSHEAYPNDPNKANPLHEEWVPVIKLISQLGYGVSLLALLAALCLLTATRRLRCPRNILHQHLFISFILRAFMGLLRDIFFDDGIGLSSDKYIVDGKIFYTWRCKTLTVLWRYSIAANYMWILAVGLYLHNLVLLALPPATGSILIYITLGWGNQPRRLLSYIRRLLQRKWCSLPNNEMSFIAGETFSRVYDFPFNVPPWVLIVGFASAIQNFTIQNYAFGLSASVHYEIHGNAGALNVPTEVIFNLGSPAIWVIPWAAARVLVEDTLCWTTHQNAAVDLILRLPVGCSVVVSFFLFLNVVRVLLTKLRATATQMQRTKRYLKMARSTFILIPLFGVHYALFLLLSYSEGRNHTIEIAWLLGDQLFASFQGLLVGILYCFMNAEVRTEVSRRWLSWRQQSKQLQQSVEVFDSRRESALTITSRIRTVSGSEEGV